MMGLEKIMTQLEQVLTGPRLRHSLAVAQMAAQLACRFGANPEQAYLAGLLHDYARDLAEEKLLALARREGLFIEPTVEKQVPMLLHGPVGAFLAQSRLGITNPQLLDAIRYHTTGRAGMGILEQLVFVADALEPGRQYPQVEELRREVSESSDPDKAVELLITHSLIYNIKKGVLLHPASLEALNWLRSKARQVIRRD